MCGVTAGASLSVCVCFQGFSTSLCIRTCTLCANVGEGMDKKQMCREIDKKNGERTSLAFRAPVAEYIISFISVIYFT